MRQWIARTNDAKEIYKRQIVQHYFQFHCLTGLRTGSETKDLRWKDIKYRKQVHIFIADGKQGGGNSIAMPQIKEVLKSWKNICKATDNDDIIFDIHSKSEEGGVKSTYTNLFSALLDEMEIKKDRKGMNRSFYSCRHTYITNRILLGGVDDYRLAKNTRTGRDRIADFYDDVIPDDIADMLAATNGSAPNPHADEDEGYEYDD